MWVYALFFSSKEIVNAVKDPDWKIKTEAICLAAKDERNKLIDLTLVKDSGPDALDKRADIVDTATMTLATMITEIGNLAVNDEKGSAIVPLWLSDYRVYIDDRLAYTALLREGINEPFAETILQGIPLSEKISTFAADNQIASCKPPIDLSV